MLFKSRNKTSSTRILSLEYQFSLVWFKLFIDISLILTSMLPVCIINQENALNLVRNYDVLCSKDVSNQKMFLNRPNYVKTPLF